MIFLVGPHGSGKTLSANLIAPHGFLTVDSGPTLRQIHQKQDTNLSFGDWITEGERHYGQRFTDDLLVCELKLAKMRAEETRLHKDIVIVGNRSKGGIVFISERIKSVNGYSNQVVFLDAPFKILHERYNSREKKNLSDDEFNELLDLDVRMGLNTIREIAQFNIWNNGDLESLRESLDKILFQKLHYAQN